jgi:hypothetical protein
LSGVADDELIVPVGGDGTREVALEPRPDVRLRSGDLLPPSVLLDRGKALLEPVLQEKRVGREPKSEYRHEERPSVHLLPPFREYMHNTRLLPKQAVTHGAPKACGPQIDPTESVVELRFRRHRL